MTTAHLSAVDSADRTLAASGPGPRLVSTPHEIAASTVRVLVADSQRLVRAGIRLILEATGRITVVGEAANAREAVALAHRLRPDVVLIDAALSEVDGIDVTRELSSQPDVAVMLLTTSDDTDYTLAALRAGATGVLLKDTEPAQLARHVEALSRGEPQLSPRLTHRLITELASQVDRASPSPDLLDELTARERQVVTLVGHGLRNNEIADHLVVTPATAKTHVSRAMAKLGAHDRANLVVFAYESGLVLPRASELSMGRRLATV